MESSLAQNQSPVLTDKDTAVVIDHEKEANNINAETSLIRKTKHFIFSIEGFNNFDGIK